MAFENKTTKGLAQIVAEAALKRREQQITELAMELFPEAENVSVSIDIENEKIRITGLTDEQIQQVLSQSQS